jgi:IS30 family transposase
MTKPSGVPRDIHRSLFIGSRRSKKLMALRRNTRPRDTTQKTSIHGQITDAVSIASVPAVEDRAPPWPLGRRPAVRRQEQPIATLVERQSRHVMLENRQEGYRDGRERAHQTRAEAAQELYRSLTWDRGKEMADHRRFTLATDIKVYFCDPRSPWRSGSNENANGLLRQYLPKGIDLSGYSQAKLNAIARRLNERPRKTLDYETPALRFHEAVASTG